MKRIVIVFCLIIAASIFGHAQMRPDNLPPLVSEAVAGPPVMLQIAGGGVPAGGSSTCTTSNDSDLVTVVTYSGATSSQDCVGNNRARAQEFYQDATWTLTEIEFACSDSAGVGNLLVTLYTDNSGVPGSVVSDTQVSISNTEVGSSKQICTATLASPKTGLSAGSYHIVWVGDNASGAFGVFVDATTPDGAVDFNYDLSFPSSWDTQTDRDVYLVIRGCE